MGNGPCFVSFEPNLVSLRRDLIASIRDTVENAIEHTRFCFEYRTIFDFRTKERRNDREREKDRERKNLRITAKARRLDAVFTTLFMVSEEKRAPCNRARRKRETRQCARSKRRAAG